MKQTRILIIDPSVLVCQTLTQMLAGESNLQVVATAQDLAKAQQLIDTLEPNIILLAAEMDGIAFTQGLMQRRPLPIILMSALGEKDAQGALDALEVGVFGLIKRPHDPTDLMAMLEIKRALKAKLLAAANAQVKTPLMVKKKTRTLHYRVKREGLPLIAIGASTGGASALEYVLQRFPSISPPLVVVQHMPEAFIRPFAARLNKRSQMTVVEAVDGAPLQNGYAYIAPANCHLTIGKLGGKYVCQLDREPAVRGHRASIDKLFKSVAETIGADAIGVVLTGMGDDGAEGLLAMRECGAYTMTQDQESSLVYSMPQAAMAAGAAVAQLSLKQIARRVIDICNNKEVA